MISTEPEGALGSCAVARGRRYAERTKLPRLASLGNEFLPNSQGLISVCLEFLVQAIKMHIKVLFEFFQSDSVNTTSTLVPLHSVPGQFQVLPLVNLVHQRVDLPFICWIQPVRQSPRAITSGSFTKGTCPRHRSYSLIFLVVANHLCQLPSPAHSELPIAATWEAFGHTAFAVLEVSGRRGRTAVLAPVRRSNRTCSFPASGFHKNASTGQASLPVESPGFSPRCWIRNW